MSPRPKNEITKNNQYRLRMTNEELQKLEYCCELTGLKKADVIREGIDMVYKAAQKQK